MIDSEEETKHKRVDKRYHRWCPIPNCPAKPQKKLPNHFDSYHKNLSKEDRARYLKLAKHVPRGEKRPIKRLRGQQTLEASFMSLEKEREDEEEEEEKEEEEEEDGRSGTRGFPSYPVDEDPSLISFKAYLRSIAGKMRRERQADHMTKDFSDLHVGLIPFRSGSGCWRRTCSYMQKLERHGVGPDGQTQKLDALDAAVRYYREEILEDDSGNVVYGKAMKIADRLTVWRANLRKKRSKLQTARLEKQSAKKHHVTLEEVNKMLSCKQIWEDFAGVVDSLRKGLPVKNQELNLCTTIIAALLIFRSWQRPGAAMNATLDE